MLSESYHLALLKVEIVNAHYYVKEMYLQGFNSFLKQLILTLKDRCQWCLQQPSCNGLPLFSVSMNHYSFGVSIGFWLFNDNMGKNRVIDF